MLRVCVRLASLAKRSSCNRWIYSSSPAWLRVAQRPGGRGPERRGVLLSGWFAEQELLGPCGCLTVNLPSH